MPRSVPEWIATSDDQAIPTRVKLRVWERCGGRCALSGRKLRPGDAYDFDHIKPLILGGGHREGNLQVVARDKHREKSAVEQTELAVADRIRAKHLGIRKTKGPKLQGRGFQKWGYP